MSVSDIATADVVTATPDAPLTELVEKMAREEVGTVVIEADDEPVSIVSDRAIAMALRDTPDVSGLTAEDVMTDELITVRADAELTNALEIMREEAIRRVPVVDDGDQLAGIVSLDDVMVELSEQSDKATEVIQKQAGPM